MSEKVLPFPEGNDWFAWRSANGELIRVYKGRYVLLRNKGGGREIQYINPDLGNLEDIVLEYDGNTIIEKRVINSGKNYGEFLDYCRRLNEEDIKPP